MSKRENLIKQHAEAERKIKSIEQNILQLEAKKVAIDNQILAQQEKIKKIRFFQGKNQKAIESC